MSSFDFSLYDYGDTSPKITNKKSSANKENPKEFDFELYEYNPKKEESVTKNLSRKGLQFAKGLARATSPGLAYDIATQIPQFVGTGEALNEFEELNERLPELKAKFGHLAKDLPNEIDREKYMEAVQNASEYFPTIENLSKISEEQTGIPLEAKTPVDRLFGLSGMAAKFAPNGLASKTIAAIGAPATSGGLQLLGVPEPLSDIGGLASSQIASSAAKNITKQLKPSGLTQRRFESVKKPTRVSENIYNKINDVVENDFRTISDEILSKKNQIYNDMKVNPSFFEDLDKQFEKVSKLSEEIPNKLDPYELKSDLMHRGQLKTKKGISPDETEIEFNKEIKRLTKQIQDSKFHTAHDYVEQYRKNNKSLKKYYEPGKSAAFNEAKKEALLEYNRAIANQFEKNFPDSEFVKLFKETNATNRVAKDVEKVNSFVNDLTEGKINFKKGKSFFEDKFTKDAFKRVLGEDGLKEYELLIKDLLSLEQPMSYIKKADNAGFWDVAKQAVPYMINPKVGAVTSGYKLYKNAMNHLLSEPRLIPVWRRGIQEMKSGKFAAAQKTFEFLNREMQSVQNTPQE